MPATRENIKRLIHTSKELENQAHPAKSSLNYDGVRNDDVYPTQLDEELRRLRNASSPLSEQEKQELKCLPYILTVDRIEQTVEQSRQLLVDLQRREQQLQKKVGQETALHDELTALRELLRQRLDTVKEIHTKSPEEIIQNVQLKKYNTNKRNKTMLSELKRVLSDYVAPKIAQETGQDEHEVHSDLKGTVEELLNEMFDSKGNNNDGYIRVNNMNSPIVEFLLKGELVSQRYDDPRFIKLREFGKD